MKKKTVSTVLSIALTAALAAGMSVYAEENANITELVQQETMAESVSIGISEDPQSLQPFGGPKDATFCYETMGTRDAFAGEFYGVLMESWEQTGEKEFTAKIYDYIVDQAGNPLTASDVAFSWNKAKEVGELGEINAVESIEAVDDTTVVFTWAAEPTLGSFESMMSEVFIVTEAAYNASADGMATTPVGTSPYKVTNYVSGVEIDFEYTGSYWQKPELCKTPGQIHNVEKIKLQLVQESAQMTNALATNQIDLSAKVTSEDIPNFAEGGQYAGTYNVDLVNNDSGYALIPNCSEESPLHDENLRKAVFWAIDTAMMETALLGEGGQVNIVFGDSRYPDYDAAWEENYIGADMEKAMEYMAASEYPDGCNLVLHMSSGLLLKDSMAELIQAYLSMININVEIKSMPIGQYLQNEGDPAGWDLGLANFSAPDYLINVWIKLFDATGRENGTKNFIVDEDLQALIATAASIDGHTAEAMTDLFNYLNDHAYVYGLIQPYNNVVYNKDKIAGYCFDMNIRLAPGAFLYN